MRFVRHDRCVRIGTRLPVTLSAYTGGFMKAAVVAGHDPTWKVRFVFLNYCSPLVYSRKTFSGIKYNSAYGCAKFDRRQTDVCTFGQLTEV